MKVQAFLITLVLLPFSTLVLAEKDIYQGKLEDRVNAISKIQPGLAVIMHEIGYRAKSMYLAANGGNWRLAQCQLLVKP